jgi:Rrf2 family protein
MVSKILKVLVREGLLDSHRGVKGGYSLSRPPEEISMAEVVVALEGPIAITECIDDQSGCSHEPICPVRGRWHRINAALREALAGISLAEMAETPEPKLVTLGRRPVLSDGAGRAAAAATLRPEH